MMVNPIKGDLSWKKNVQFANLLNLWKILQKVKRANTDTMRNVKNADMQKQEELISLGIRKDAMKMQQSGIKIIEKLLMKGVEKDILKIKQLLLKETVSIQKRSKLSIWSKLMLEGERLLSRQFVQFAIVRQKKLKDIMQITPSLWKLSGYVLNATTIFINLLRSVCSLNDQTLRALTKRMRWPEHYGNIMRKSEISSRLEIGHKVTDLITNDLWMQNLRSTGI